MRPFAPLVRVESHRSLQRSHLNSRARASLLALACLAGGIAASADDAHAQEGSASGSVGISTQSGASADADAAAAPAASAPAEDDDAPAWDLTHRVYSGWNGSSGGPFVDDPGGVAEPGALRLQLAVDSFSGDGFLYNGDTVEQDRQQLSVSWTALRMLELFASLINRATSSDTPERNSLHAFGDFELGAKVGVPIGKLLRVGGSARVLALGDTGEHGSLLDATSVGLRASGALDLQGLEDPLPLIVRLNVDYALDNSSKVLDDIEALRYDDLGDQADDEDETRHLISRVERFGFAVNRVDMLSVGVGVEVPLELAEDLYLYPLADFRIGLPINRQSFNCAYRSTDDERGTTEAGSDDTCLDDAGVESWPMSATIGARFAPPIKGVSLLVGVNLGISGTSTFVRELSPTPPYRLLIALSYDYDARPSAPQTPAEVPAPAAAVVTAVPAAPAKGRVQGRISDQTSTAPIAGVLVRVKGSELPPTASDGGGRFSSYPLDAGNVELELSHPDYQPGRCSAVLPAGGGDAEAVCALAPLPGTGSVKLSVRDQFGATVGGARVVLVGASTQSVAADANGVALMEGLAEGEYSARVENDAYLMRVVRLSVARRQQTSTEIALVQRPGRRGLERKGQEIRLAALKFEGGSVELGPAAAQAVAELADLMLRDPNLRIRIQGDGGESLALGRALAVKQRLIDAGVADSRVEAATEAAGKPSITALP